MADDFGILFKLLDRYTPEVGGRAAPNISGEIREKLAIMAAGSCDETQRQEVIKLLTERSDLVPELAQEVIKLRKLPR